LLDPAHRFGAVLLARDDASPPGLAANIVRRTAFETGALTGVLLADRLDRSRFCSPFR